MTEKLGRRRYLAATGAAVSAVALAGCADDDAEPADGDADGETDDDADDGGAGDVPDRIDEFLADARGYDGTIVDATGQDEVVVDVGAGDDGLSFDPAAVRIDAGTTVRWEWTGRGGSHNVVSVEESDSDFDSGDAVNDEDEVFEQSFDDDGIQLYQCTPHVGVGMFGAIDVVDE